MVVSVPIFSRSNAVSLLEDFVKITCVANAYLVGNILYVDIALQTKNLVVLSPSIKADEPQAATLKNIIGYVPMLNLGTNLYSTWGYGTPVATSTDTLKVEESQRLTLSSIMQKHLCMMIV